jgi:hypothetical protein
MLVLCDLPISKDVLWERFAVVREVEDMQHIFFFLLHHLPAEVYNGLEAQGFVVLFPSVANQDGIGLWQWV